ncbi:MAG: cation diffusion facilitator family transporter [Breznakia sp.]
MQLLIRFFIRDYKNIKSSQVRTSYGKVTSIFGIFLNLLLFVSKFLIGMLSKSVAISADAFNNLSDAGSSIISLVSFIFSSKPADEDHPFGHERLEYVFSMAIAFIILYFGITLAVDSFSRIFNPQSIIFNEISLVVLGMSIVVKLYMYGYNKKYGKLIASSVMEATAVDSIADVLATSVVLVGTLLSKFLSLQLDGVLGLLVAVFILKSGYEIIKDTLDNLIGVAPDFAFSKDIVKRIMEYQGVLGVHDLVVHTYGPKKTFITVHVEVDSHKSIVESHDVIDNIEKDFSEDHNINLVIHMDPIDIDDPYTNEMRLACASMIARIDERLKIHDFRVVKGDTHNNFIFDVSVPVAFSMSDNELKERIKKDIPQGEIPNYVVVTIEQSYTSTIDKKIDSRA